jgi:L-ribulose-5-phosphate 4-epimerase
VPAVLVASHGPFCWGPTAAVAAHNAVIILHSAARTDYYTVTLARKRATITGEHHDKHLLRKHGRGADYGQVKAK